jgi:HEAT repeat protein/energy-coupling factor transporter ATP-binding protein EcfA2
MNKYKSSLNKVFASIAVVTGTLAGIFGTYSGLKELIDKAFIWLNLELPSKGSSILIIMLIIIVLILIYHLIKKIKESVDERYYNEEKIRQVYLKWLGKDLENRLKSNLHRATFILLNKKEELNKVDSCLFQDYYSTTNDDKKNNFIDDYFIRDDKRILLLGAPGSGKTTTLLKILEKLHKEAMINEEYEIPIYLNLSSWGQSLKIRNVYLDNRLNLFKRQKIADLTPDIKEWIIEQLTNNHAVFQSSKILEEWLTQKKLIFLFDGLDEVNVTLRSKLLSKLNTFIKEYTTFNTKLIICSRIADYEALIETTSTKLFLDGAVSLKPFSSVQIEEYLNYTDSYIVKKIIRKDLDMQKMASNPLMLSLMVLAFRNAYIPPKITDGILSYTFKKLYLFSCFVDSMIKRKVLRDDSDFKISESMYSLDNELLESKIAKRIRRRTEKVKNYLSWLAIRLSASSRTTFYYNNIFGLLKTGRMSSNIILQTNVIFAIVLSIFIFLISSPYPLFSIIIFSFDEELKQLSVFSFMVLIIYFIDQKTKLPNSTLKKNKFEPKLLVHDIYVYFFYIFSVSYIFNGLNLFLSKDFIVTFITPIILFAINSAYIFGIGLKNREDLRNLIFINIYIILGGHVGLFILSVAAAYISLFLFILLIFSPIKLNTNENEVIKHITFMGFGGCLLSIINPLLAPLGAISFYFLVWIWFKGGYNLQLKILEEIFVEIALRITGTLPFRFRSFINYCVDALLLRDVKNGFEFNHRYIRDYFAIQHILNFEDDFYSIEKRIEITKDLVKLKDASCDVLLELVEDQDKQVRITCIEGLGDIGTSLSAQVLIKIINTTEKGLSDIALESLKMIRDYSSIPILFRFAKSNPIGSKEYNAAIYALAKMDELEVLNNVFELKSLINNKSVDEFIKRSAFLAIINLQPNSACSLLSENPELYELSDNPKIASIIIKHLDIHKYINKLMQKDHGYFAFNKSIEILESFKNMGLKINLDDIKNYIIYGDTNTKIKALKILLIFNKAKAISELNKMKLDSDKELRVFVNSISIWKNFIWKLKSFLSPFLMETLNIKNFITKINSAIFLYEERITVLSFLNKEKALNRYLKYLKSKTPPFVHRAWSAYIISHNLSSAIPDLLKILKIHHNPEIIRVLIHFNKLDLLETELFMCYLEHIPYINFVSYAKEKEFKEVFPYILEIYNAYGIRNLRHLFFEEVFKDALEINELIDELKKMTITHKSEIYPSSSHRLLIDLGVKDIIPYTVNMIVKYKYNVDILYSYFPPKITLESVLESFDYTDDYLILASALILTRVWPQKSLLKLHNLVTHEKAEVRYSVAFGLGEIGSTRSLPRLKNLLQDSVVVSVSLNVNHKYVSDAALEAIEKIGTPEAKKIIEEWRNSIN